MQMETTMKYHYIPIKITKMKKMLTVASICIDIEKHKVLMECAVQPLQKIVWQFFKKLGIQEKLGLLYIAGGNIKWDSFCGKQHCFSSKNLNTELPHDSFIPLQGIYSKELKAGIQTDTCTPMLIAVFFIIAQS